MDVSLFQKKLLLQDEIHRRPQPRQPGVLRWPDQQLEPLALFRVGDINRIRVQSCAPCNGGQGIRYRHMPAHLAVQDNLLAGGDGPQDRITKDIAVAVGKEAQSGRGADFKKCQRLRKAAKQGQERGASARLVGLRAMRKDDSLKIVRISQHDRARLTERRHVSQEPAQRCQEQVGLALVPGQGRNHLDEVRIFGDPQTEIFIDRAPVAGLLPGEKEKALPYLFPRYVSDSMVQDVGPSNSVQIGNAGLHGVGLHRSRVGSGQSPVAVD